MGVEMVNVETPLRETYRTALDEQCPQTNAVLHCGEVERSLVGCV